MNFYLLFELYFFLIKFSWVFWISWISSFYQIFWFFIICKYEAKLCIFFRTCSIIENIEFKIRSCTFLQWLFNVKLIKATQLYRRCHVLVELFSQNSRTFRDWLFKFKIGTTYISGRQIATHKSTFRKYLCNKTLKIMSQTHTTRLTTTPRRDFNAKIEVMSVVDCQPPRRRKTGSAKSVKKFGQNFAIGNIMVANMCSKSCDFFFIHIFCILNQREKKKGFHLLSAYLARRNTYPRRGVRAFCGPPSGSSQGPRDKFDSFAIYDYRSSFGWPTAKFHIAPQ